jgi:hypothetical protein
MNKITLSLAVALAAGSANASLGDSASSRSDAEECAISESILPEGVDPNTCVLGEFTRVTYGDTYDTVKIIPFVLCSEPAGTTVICSPDEDGDTYCTRGSVDTNGKFHVEPIVPGR